MADRIVTALYGLNTQNDRSDCMNPNSPSSSNTSNEKKLSDEEDDADMEALISELEREDGRIDLEDEGTQDAGIARPLPNELLQTNPRYGLTDNEVLVRRKKYGWNKMKEEKENLVIKFFSYFTGPIQFVMEVSPHHILSSFRLLMPQAAAILAAGLRDWVDFAVICGLLLLNAFVGFIQEFQAGSIVEELKKTLALKAVAIRNGEPVDIGAPDVVPGDILLIEEACLINLHSTR